MERKQKQAYIEASLFHKANSGKLRDPVNQANWTEEVRSLKQEWFTVSSRGRC